MGQQQQQQCRRIPLPRLLAFAAAVRVAYLLLIAGLARVLKPYDTSSQLTSGDCDPRWPEALAAGAAASHGRPPRLLVWDTVFFHRIASCGYEFEQYHAFFPGAPALVAFLQRHLLGSSSNNNLDPAAFAAAWLALSAAASLASVALLARLGGAVLRDERVAAAAALLLALHPASPFLAAAYTEAPFVAGTLAGLYALYVWPRSMTPAALALAAAATLRSNGVVNAAFLLHEAARRALAAAFERRRLAALFEVLRGVALTALVAAPCALLQLDAFARYCGGGDGGDDGAVLPPRPYCALGPSAMYGWIQAHYWGVGLFRYWTLKQAPNFLLASPTLALTVAAVVAYARASPAALLTGGLLPPPLLERVTARVERRRRERAAAERAAAEASAAAAAIPGVAYASLRRRAVSGAARPSPPNSLGGRAVADNVGDLDDYRHRGGVFGPNVAVFVVHLAAMASLAAVAMHVQVATRFLTSCPAWYWFGAHLALGGGGGGKKGGRTTAAALLWAFCYAYMALGAVLFPAFYPWT